MLGGLYDSSLTRVQPFFQALFARDPSGRSWLPALLGATRNGQARLGELLDEPGYLQTQLAVKGVSGRLGCFDFPTGPPRELLTWFIDHPRQLVWPPHAELSPETVKLRRALLNDDPSGSQARAQDRARDLVRTRPPSSQGWWGFEGVSRLDCVLITDRLVITVQGKRTEPLAPATDWYPQRSELVRDLEAAKRLSEGKRQWASLLLSETLLAEGTHDALARSLPAAAPHLDDDGRRELSAAYLGNLTWADACASVDLPIELLPETTADAVQA